MISKEFAQFFIDKHACDEQFVKMAKAMGVENAEKPQDFITALSGLQKQCGVDNLKMSDFGISPDEALTLAKGARSMQGGLFEANPCEMSDEDCAGIFVKSVPFNTPCISAALSQTYCLWKGTERGAAAPSNRMPPHAAPYSFRQYQTCRISPRRSG